MFDLGLALRFEDFAAFPWPQVTVSLRLLEQVMPRVGVTNWKTVI